MANSISLKTIEKSHSNPGVSCNIGKNIPWPDINRIQALLTHARLRSWTSPPSDRRAKGVWHSITKRETQPAVGATPRGPAPQNSVEFGPGRARTYHDFLLPPFVWKHLLETRGGSRYKPKPVENCRPKTISICDDPDKR